ncbi:MAG: tetratricopeptide repeat protein [Eubacteriales bacterium]|nr:tetratricopeptide repeat protein [Eubacteriales bacterium]
MVLLKNRTVKPKEPKLKPEDYDIKERLDRLGIYLKKYTRDFVFDEFGDAFIERTGFHYLNGVPVPLRKRDLESFRGGNGLEVNLIIENINHIIGIDPKFKYMESYLKFLETFDNEKIVNTLVKEGCDFAETKDYDNAVIHFRAALCIQPDDINAMYNYALVCREMYLAVDDEKYIGRLKAESIEYFELLVEIHPGFDQGYYYLGYAYLNLGLYIKAKLIWEKFLEMTNDPEDKSEIEIRLEQMEQPIRIEEGCNFVLSGKYELGIIILEPFLSTKFKDWWPMSYYLGIAYDRAGDKKGAITSFKRALTLNPSHLESMDELANIYAENKDKDNERKYRIKAELIRSGGYKE